MGCAICLEPFGTDSLRPTALTCGHLFHNQCVTQWFSSNQSKSACPICKTVATNVVKLYPSDTEDLDRYLQPKETLGQDQLLGDLLDFNQAMQSYVMALHGVRVETAIKAGIKVRVLVHDLQADKRDLTLALDALERAVQIFQDKTESIAEQEISLQTQQAQLTRRQGLLDQQEKDLKHDGQKLVAKQEKLQQDGKAIQSLVQSLESRAAEQQKVKDRLHARHVSLENKEKHVEACMRSCRVEAAQKVRAHEQSARVRLEEMEEDRNIAVQRQKEAEKERDSTTIKNNALAEQLRYLQSEVKKCRLKLSKRSEEKDTVVLRKEVGELQRQLRREKARGRASQVSSSPPTSKRPYSLVVESEDLDKELLEEELYPMPGGVLKPRAFAQGKENLSPPKPCDLPSWITCRTGMILGPKRKHR